MLRVCKKCEKPLGKRIRPWTTGFCHTCRLKEKPPALGKKRPDMIGNNWNPAKSGKNNYFSSHKYVGENHARWKGDDVGYEALHAWVQRQLGKPDTCKNCNESGLKGHQIHWANLSGDYKRNVDDWVRLCAKCHYDFDRNQETEICFQ